MPEAGVGGGIKRMGYGNERYDDRGYGYRGYDHREYRGRGYGGRGYDHREYDNRRYENRGFGEKQSDIADVTSLLGRIFLAIALVAILFFVLGAIVRDYNPNGGGKSAPSATPLPGPTPGMPSLSKEPM